MDTEKSWLAIDTLVANHAIVIDRPRGSIHPRHPDTIYALDYGYLDGTTSGDGGGIDIWRGSLPQLVATGVILTIDLQKKDSEIKLLLACTAEEQQMVLELHQAGLQSALLVERP
jgi:inorganic pyrophosphatase